jgi:hypothetical protein
MTDVKRTPEDRWRTLNEAALGPDARELEERSDEEVARNLRAKGADPERIAREGAALALRLMGEEGFLGGDAVAEGEHERDRARDRAPAAPILAGPIVLSFPRRRARWPLLLVAATVGAIAIPTAVTIAYRHDPVVPDHGPSPIEVAAQLRIAAEHDCDHLLWQACLDKLDEARTLDHSGDDTRDVQRMRSAATTALRPPPPEPRRNEDEKKKAP